MSTPQALPDALEQKEIVELAEGIEVGLDALISADERGPSNHSAANWASEIHHPCLRHLVYCRTNWQEKTPIDLDGLYRVKEGQRQEKELKLMIEQAGFEIELAQARFTWPEFEISGRIDGMARRPGRGSNRFPLEIKAPNPLYWDKLRTIEDVKHSRFWWIQKMVSQLNLYMFMAGCEAGLLALKTFGKRPRILPMMPDYDLADLDTMKARKVNEHVKAGTLPEPIPYERLVCDLCSFQHLCSPLKVLDASWTELDEASTIELELYLEAKEQKAYCNKLHARLIGTHKEPGRYHGKNALYESIAIISKPRQMTTYNIPAEIKAPFKESQEIIVTSIERIK